MSDPDVRRDEETKATTVEHIKLLRNRLEATTKGHMEELQAYLLQTTETISRGLGMDTREAGERVDAGAGVFSGGGGARGGGQAGAELKQIVNERFSEVEEKLEARTAALEARMGAMIDDRLGALGQKLDAVLSRHKPFTRYGR